MKPNQALISINDNQSKIKQLLSELVLEPRTNALKWSAITRQTPNIKVGYPGQHLASLITGMLGERTGARGNDLSDGSEVKSCSRIDQLDVCKDCKSPVARAELVCPTCNSKNISRKDDSKWLFSVKSESDLKVLTVEVKRVILIIGDYPNFEDGDFDTLRFQAFEIWTNSPRCSRFREIMENYYYKIYLGHKSKDQSKTPAPKNFWPYSYQFYLCNPILTFSCTIKNATTNPVITIDKFTDPKADRSEIESEPMPSWVLDDVEFGVLVNSANKKDLQNSIDIPFDLFSKLPTKKQKEHLTFINENLRNLLPLRDTDKISTAKKAYSRRTTSQIIFSEKVDL